MQDSVERIRGVKMVYKSLYLSVVGKLCIGCVQVVYKSSLYRFMNILCMAYAWLIHDTIGLMQDFHALYVLGVQHPGS